MSAGEQKERRRERRCPSCGGASMIRGCKVPGVQLQIVTGEGEQRSGLIGLYSDVCVDCGLTSFYARRAEVADQMQEMDIMGAESGGNPPGASSGAREGDGSSA
jgi:hypothetical protein